MTPAADLNERSPSWLRWLLWGMVAVGLLLPLVFYGLFFGTVETMRPPQALEVLRHGDESAVLVDVRPVAAFEAQHIDGAQSWPLDGILAADDPADVPERLAGKRMLLICDGGINSVLAARHLDALSVEGAASVRGGIDEWIGMAGEAEPGPYLGFRTASGETVAFPFRETPGAAQLAIVVAAFVVKPLYTLISFVLIVVLWRSRAADLAALRLAMICFFVGENCCAVNFLFYAETSYLLEYLHMFGMLLCFGFTTYALLEGIDLRILRLSDPEGKCAALGLCRRCVKYAEVPCGLKRAFLLIVPACIVVACMPLCADWQAFSYNTTIYDSPYHFAHLWYQRVLETHYCSIAAIVMLTVSLLILCFKREDPLPPAKFAFAAAMGPMGFGFFRLLLATAYSRDLLWNNFWEESTELLFVVAVGVVLWIFRQGLFAKQRS